MLVPMRSILSDADANLDLRLFFSSLRHLLILVTRLVKAPYEYGTYYQVRHMVHITRRFVPRAACGARYARSKCE